MVNLKKTCNKFMTQSDLEKLDEYIKNKNLSKIKSLLIEYDGRLIEHMLYCDEAFDIFEELN